MTHCDAFCDASRSSPRFQPTSEGETSDRDRRGRRHHRSAASTPAANPPRARGPALRHERALTQKLASASPTKDLTNFFHFYLSFFSQAWISFEADSARCVTLKDSSGEKIRNLTISVAVLQKSF